MYQQTRLSDTSAIGTPGELPAVIATWGDAPELLADLTGHVDPQFGFDGTGFWPVDVTEPTFDPSSQVLVAPTACDKADPVAKRWTATATVRAMTAEEFAVANPVPNAISDRQFGQGLWSQGIISFAECQAFVATGTIPAKMQTLIDALPDDATGAPTARKTAIVFVSGAKEYDRDNPLVDELGAAFGWSPTEIDANWRAWALL